MTREFVDVTHRVFYWAEAGRCYWECQTCSAAGSVNEWYDAEIVAESFHRKRGVTHLSTVNKRVDGSD